MGKNGHRNLTPVSTPPLNPTSFPAELKMLPEHFLRQVPPLCQHGISWDLHACFSASSASKSRTKLELVEIQFEVRSHFKLMWIEFTGVDPSDTKSRLYFIVGNSYYMLSKIQVSPVDGKLEGEEIRRYSRHRRTLMNKTKS